MNNCTHIASGRKDGQCATCITTMTKLPEKLSEKTLNADDRLEIALATDGNTKKINELIDFLHSKEEASKEKCEFCEFPKTEHTEHWNHYFTPMQDSHLQ